MKQSIWTFGRRISLFSFAVASLAILLSSAPATAASAVPDGQATFERIKSLAGQWEAPTKDGVMTDIFRPFAFGTAVLGEEWMGGKQITSTVFYMVGNELWADHFCDYKNQPHYTAKPSVDPAVIDFEFRGATNLDVYPRHFHSTVWKLLDGNHLTQDWFVQGGTKANAIAHMEFTRTK